jgi:hypothetical protein
MTIERELMREEEEEKLPGGLPFISAFHYFLSVSKYAR